MSSVSESEMKCFTYTWTIENISHCLKRHNEKLYSPVFIANTLDETEWRLWLSLGDDEISCFLHREKSDAGPSTIVLNLDIAILSKGALPLVSQERKSQSFIKNFSWHFSGLCKRDELCGSRRNSFLPRDTLTVRCRMRKRNLDIPEAVLCFARTRIGIQKRTFTWSIKKFGSLQPHQENILNVDAISKQAPPLTFKLFLDCDGNIQIEVGREDSDDGKQNNFLRCIISAVDEMGDVIDSIDVVPSFDIEANFPNFKFPQFLTKNKITSNPNRYLKDDTLSLIGQCEFYVGAVLNQIESCGSISNSVKNGDVRNMQCLIGNEFAGDFGTLKSDIGYLYKEQKLCDFTIKTGETTFPVHKAILCARSPVFCAMLRNDTEEKLKDSVEVPDVNPSTMKKLLHFVYFDAVDDLEWEGATQLYFAADKYELLSLKQICSAFLKSGICPDNACEILVLADMHQDQELKSISRSFVFEHGNKIVGSEGWRSLEQSHVQLALETLEYLFLRKVDVCGCTNFKSEPLS